MTRIPETMIPPLDPINSHTLRMRESSDADLAAQTLEFRELLRHGASLEEIEPEAFALVREVSWRILHLRLTDEQVLAGLVLHRGKVAEIGARGENALVAAPPAYLNSLLGKAVHMVAIDDWTARRDYVRMYPVFRALGVSVGLVVSDLDDSRRACAYAADITYGCSREFALDYLRDNMKFRVDDCVQRSQEFAIIDEVDAILLDQGINPLVLYGPGEDSTDKYVRANAVVAQLVRGELIEGKEPGEKYTSGDYTVDGNRRMVALTEEGNEKAARLLALPDVWSAEMMEWRHHIEQALRAHAIYKRDRDYIVKWSETDGKDEVVIVDEFTGRLVPGRRWPDGLHQAIESKEGARIEREDAALAAVTFQNFFRMYKKLAGVTNTARPDEAEFEKVYNLRVVPIPTIPAGIREEYPDVVYRTEAEKFRAAAKDIKEYNSKGQPVLAATISVERCEHLSGILKSLGVRHEVLNAKNQKHAASILAQAGRRGAVIVSTNMAGRGADISLGGNPEIMAQGECLRSQTAEPLQEGEAQVLAHEHFYYFTHDEQFYRVRRDKWDELYARFKQQTETEYAEVVALGGLHIVATERNGSCRIDKQLCGSAGREGDPGSSRFFLSLQDDLLRLFGRDRIQELMLRLGMEEDVPIESGMMTKRIRTAQEAVEARNLKSRKQLLDYDDINNKQRHAIYALRRSLMEGAGQKQHLLQVVRGRVQRCVDLRCPATTHPDTWELGLLRRDILAKFGHKVNLRQLGKLNRSELADVVLGELQQRIQENEHQAGPGVMREAQRIVLQLVDNQWKAHLLRLNGLEDGLGMLVFAKKDPLVEYEKESHRLFTALVDRAENEIVRHLFFPAVDSGVAPAPRLLKRLLRFLVRP